MPDIKHLFVLCGPTGVGKTDLSINLAKSFNTEIVSCDSRQIYKEMYIGTAVPEPEQLNAVKHHFIQTNSIHDYYNASMYEYAAIETLEELYKHTNVAFLVGGSGLYIDAIFKGIDDIPTVDTETRQYFYDKLDKYGISYLQEELKRLDPEHYNTVDLNNHKRVQKALEICKMTGKPYSSFLTKSKKDRSFETHIIVLDRDRDELYKRINLRVTQMVEMGLVAEAEKLHQFKSSNALNTVGYKELFAHFEGKDTLDDAIEKIQNNTRKYARKQLTWFRRYKDAAWFHPENEKEIINYITAKIKS